MERAALSHHHRPVKWPAPSRSRIQHALRVIDMRPGRVGDVVTVRSVAQRRLPRVASSKTFATR